MFNSNSTKIHLFFFLTVYQSAANANQAKDRNRSRNNTFKSDVLTVKETPFWG